MSQRPATSSESMIPKQSMPADGEEFSNRMHGLMDGQPKDEATVGKAMEGMDGMFDLIAAGLYNMASMLVGEGEDSIQLVETAVATAEVSVCQNPVEARQSSRRALCIAALGVIDRRDPGILSLPEDLKAAATCIDDDDLDAAGESGAELLRMLAGPDRDRVRSWLASLATIPRTIFVFRAVAGFTPAETAKLLSEHGGPRAAGWTEGAVREFCRQALCSLASQLLQAAR